MEFLVNDLSLDGQYPDAQTFQKAIGRLMNMRDIAKRFGREIFCHRKVASAQVTPTMTMPQIIQQFDDRNKRQSIMQWLTRTGPFWEDERMHGPDDYLMCQDEIVTDSAVGEAAWLCLKGIERHLVSFKPSLWEISPLSVSFFEEEKTKESVEVHNFWELSTLAKRLENTPALLDSWVRLREAVILRFPHLLFSKDAFSALEGHPFVHGAAQRLMVLLKLLDRFKTCHDDQGKRTKEGHEMYKDFFTGKKGDGGKGALFKDSSDSEKVEFKEEMTFKHPGRSGKNLFCPWHGSTQTPQFRIHFSWPVKAHEPIYIVYIGPKITKR